MSGVRPSRELRLSDGTAHLLYGQADQALQIRLRWHAAPEPRSLVLELQKNAAVSAAWLHAVQRFSRLQLTGRFGSHNSRPDPRSQRLLKIVRALDGSLAGLKQQEIAATLVGSERVAADWSHPSQYLRDHVRRAVKRGHALMNGGYFRLLR